MMDFLARVLHHFLSYPLFIKVAASMIVLCFIMIVTINISIILRRKREAALLKKQNNARQKISLELSSGIIIEDNTEDTTIRLLRKRFSRMFFRDKSLSQVVMDELIYYRRNFTDSIAKIVTGLYNSLNLDTVSFAKIGMPSWIMKAEGLREMQEMAPENSHLDVIIPLLNYENDDVRIEAQTAYLRLNVQNPFGFLGNVGQELLEWHQIILFEAILNTPGLKVPSFKALLASENKSVVIFAIKLIDHFNQLDAIPDLIKILEEPSVKIKLAAIEALSNFDAEEAEPALIALYPGEELQVKVKILDTLGRINSGKNYNFLKREFLLATDFQIIRSASCAMINNPEFTFESIKKQIPEPLSKHEEIMNYCISEKVQYSI